MAGDVSSRPQANQQANVHTLGWPTQKIECGFSSWTMYMLGTNNSSWEQTARVPSDRHAQEICVRTRSETKRLELLGCACILALYAGNVGKRAQALDRFEECVTKSPNMTKS